MYIPAKTTTEEIRKGKKIRKKNKNNILTLSLPKVNLTKPRKLLRPELSNEI